MNIKMFRRTTPSSVGRSGIDRSIVCCVYHVLELQRMFEHSNIIRLRFSRTNFFYERTFVDARWSVFLAHTLRSEASAAASRVGATNGAALEILR